MVLFFSGMDPTGPRCLSQEELFFQAVSYLTQAWQALLGLEGCVCPQDGSPWLLLSEIDV